MSHPIVKGATDQSVVIRIVDATDGTPETAVEHNTSGIDLWYRRAGATKTSITEAALAALDSAHADGGIEHIGDGYYRVDLPDAAVASGVDYVTVGGTVTGMVVIGSHHPLVSSVELNASGHVTLADDSLTAAKIASAAITAAKFGASAITSTVLADDAITAAKVASAALTSAKFGSGAITATVLADDAITAAKIAANAITSSELADGAITAAKIASDAITAAKIADGALTAAKIADAALTSAKFNDGFLTAAKIADSAITTAKVSGNLPANVKAVNDVTVSGTGASGSEWGPT